MQPHLILAKETWKQFLKEDDLAIDATCGNGYDTLFLTELCFVIGLDIQKIAIQNTQELLLRHGKKAMLHQISHERIDEIPLPRSPRLIVYNLGYLPKGDKEITTMTDSTLASIKKGIELLGPKGALSITCYPGHEEGLREEKAIEKWAEGLPSDRWLVRHSKWINRKSAPSWFWISSLF